MPLLGFVPDLHGVGDTDWWQACREFWDHLCQGGTQGNQKSKHAPPLCGDPETSQLWQGCGMIGWEWLVPGKHLLVNNLLRNGSSREWSCKFRHNSKSTFEWKVSVGDRFLKYQNISFQGNLPELFFSKCQNAVNGHFQSEFLTFYVKPAFCI